jgi:hypothetical protein
MLPPARGGGTPCILAGRYASRTLPPFLAPLGILNLFPISPYPRTVNTLTSYHFVITDVVQTKELVSHFHWKKTHNKKTQITTYLYLLSLDDFHSSMILYTFGITIEAILFPREGTNTNQPEIVKPRLVHCIHSMYNDLPLSDYSSTLV